MLRIYRKCLNQLTFTWFILFCVYSIPFTIGCSEDVEEPSKSITIDDLPPLGLHGDTYRNQRYVFKVSNLPVDDWTVMAISNRASYEIFKNWEEIWEAIYGRGGARFNKTRSLLLMQPTSKENFQDTIIRASDNEMPFIFIFVEEQTVTNEISPQRYIETLLEDMNQLNALFELFGLGKVYDFEVTDQGKIVSKDYMPGYFCEITWNPDRDKTKVSFFMRRGNTLFVYRFEFWSPADRYDELLPVYDRIVSSVEFNTM
ncbi:hypothetical protein H8E77_01890 [bacterium]|nr:hypothetical protein [bacterium]